MAIDTGRSRSRRALLAGALGGLGAVALQAIGRPEPASAGGEPVTLGEINESNADADTRIDRKSGATVLTQNVLGGEDVGLQGSVLVNGGIGVSGRGSAFGSTGVQGRAMATNGTGVLARTEGHNSQIALEADGATNEGEGYAVRARTRNGIALYGEILGPGGFALQAVGPAVFSRSGKVAFGAGQSSRTVFGHSITAASLVLATIQGNVAGTYVRGVSVNDAQDKFIIRLNKPAPSALVVGWFIVN
jgi:hypothetical protein